MYSKINKPLDFHEGNTKNIVHFITNSKDGNSMFSTALSILVFKLKILECYYECYYRRKLQNTKKKRCLLCQKKELNPQIESFLMCELVRKILGVLKF